jgi:hypothetical protein
MTYTAHVVPAHIIYMYEKISRTDRHEVADRCTTARGGHVDIDAFLKQASALCL